MPSEHLESQRAVHAQHFLVNPIEGGVQILYRGAVFMTIEKDDRLPDGFFDRCVRHVADMLSGRRTALWDEQAIYRDKPFSPGDARARAQLAADEEAEARL